MKEIIIIIIIIDHGVRNIICYFQIFIHSFKGNIGMSVGCLLICFFKYEIFLSHYIKSIFIIITYKGLFRYFTLNQVPNFMLASPMIIQSSFMIYNYLSRQIQLLSRQYNNKSEKDDNMLNNRIQYINGDDINDNYILMPFILHLLALLLIGVFIAHVQVRIKKYITYSFFHSF